MAKMENKLITFCVPSYNSASFLHYAVDSLLTGGEDVEILIIDDGSKDETGEIADFYQSAFPSIVRCVHQPNAGHGGAINTAIREASGVYFKVIDSDDWVDADALAKLIEDIKTKNAWADLYVTDYVYWQGRFNQGQRISYSRMFFRKHDCSWKDVRQFTYRCNLTLHSSMYKTSVLRESKVVLPEHVSYEDNYFVYAPLEYAKAITYLPVPLYQYLIGREGQSMEHATCVRKYRDYILDGQLVFDKSDVLKYRFTNRGLYRVLSHHLVLNTLFPVIFARLNNTPEAKADLRAFWVHLKKSNPRQYRMLRYQSLVFWITFPGKFGDKLVKTDYKLAHRVIKFN